ITGQVSEGAILVDGLGVGDVGSTVLRDRRILSEHGIIIVVMTLEKGCGQLLAGPDIISRGFVYVKESEDLIVEATELVSETLDDLLVRNITDWNKIKNAIRDTLSDFVWRKTKRSPMIMPIIMEV
ncbi:MAG: ribonuclease J, partial [Lachnospiraceae bacterium]|nr:ribonuclease J [Lachnospiraceae bacterium]